MNTRDKTADQPPWLFDEFRDVGFCNPEEIATYEKKARADATRERALLERLGVSGGHTMIEFGPGTGVLALQAAGLCKRVIAVDVSAAMLEFMRLRAEGQNIRNVAYVHQGFLSYDHLGEPVDFVITQRALHHLPDFWKVQALERIAAMLKPGGVLYLNDLVYSFEPGDAGRAIEVWLDEVAVEKGDGFSRSFFEAHVREEYSTYAWLLEAMLDKAGFRIEDAWYSDLKAYAAYTCIKR